MIPLLSELTQISPHFASNDQNRSNPRSRDQLQEAAEAHSADPSSANHQPSRWRIIGLLELHLPLARTSLSEPAELTTPDVLKSEHSGLHPIWLTKREIPPRLIIQTRRPLSTRRHRSPKHRPLQTQGNQARPSPRSCRCSRTCAPEFPQQYANAQQRTPGDSHTQRRRKSLQSVQSNFDQGFKLL